MVEEVWREREGDDDEEEEEDEEEDDAEYSAFCFRMAETAEPPIDDEEEEVEE